MHPQGTRVIAICRSEGDTLYIYGFGVYEGNFLPPAVNIDDEVELCTSEYLASQKDDPENTPPMDADSIRAMVVECMQNPRIKLDDGKVVWGYECWWMPESDFSGEKHKTIVKVDIDEEREKARLKAN